jgi:hypothetical protein
VQKKAAATKNRRLTPSCKSSPAVMAYIETSGWSQQGSRATNMLTSKDAYWNTGPQPPLTRKVSSSLFHL